PGLVAAAALLFDYMMTVVVSIVAGVFAIGSAFGWANEHRVLLSMLFVLLVTFANLRGARESGTVFAIPTYGFVASILLLVAIGIFGNSSLGFFVVQFFTAAILILAANTAYQDFPRLASILARDRFMPSQFVNRGDRLVFSNGVIVLGLLSCAMIYAFHADLN